MSLFFLSNNRLSAEAAKKRWIHVYKSAEIREIEDGFFLTVTNCFRKKNHVYQKTEFGEFFGFGTFFSEKGFHEKAFNSNLINFSESDAKEIFGHYVFLIKKGNLLRIVTDPLGLINVFWSRDGDEFAVSNDILSVAASRKDLKISALGTQQFVVAQSTLGKTTFFEEVHRLRYRYELQLSRNILSEVEFYRNKPEKLSIDEYLDRINKYFKMVANYDGIIGTDLSAGYDTRLIASCARPHIKNLNGISNDNKFDGGVDVAIEIEIAKKLKIPIEIIEREKDVPFDELKMLHGLSAGRDIIGSRYWMDFQSKKYLKNDLMLGGYGGEVLRAKYATFKDFEDFCDKYYHGRFLLNWKLGDAYKKFIQSSKTTIENECSEDSITTRSQLSNFWYAVDRMRIWGGSANLGFMIFGDRLHPFMDWNLMGPIFAFPVEELQGAKLQAMIIEHFAPGLMAVPINPSAKVTIYSRTVKLFSRVLSKIRIKKLQNLHQVYKIIPRNKINQKILQESGFSMSHLEVTNTTFLTRFLTVSRALDCSNDMKTLRETK